ncbi:hypothetical protein C4D60_Mb06t00080 [Musa balbisiana]|uniref:SnoaL-like domain-containing protein n=1 Tax=Musa balbisiana TaxID=52838 RepID=A0A4S8IJJ3_MUSBA|nr:hypothetical protein C4D60_Mb06t00080 [Musa balbisiana]
MASTVAGSAAAVPIRGSVSATGSIGRRALLRPAGSRSLRFALSKRVDVELYRPVLQPQSSLRRLTRVISGEAEGNPSTEDTMLDEQTLQQDLEVAIKDEDYARAAQIRDRLRILHEDSKASVLSANARFYHAFKNGDLAAMHSIWAKGEHVYVIHPGAGTISGYEMVMGSWEIVCNADYEFPLQIDLKNVEVHVRGNVGYVSCMEVVKTKGSSWGKQVATNVFERINGQWFICIHHASHIDE